MRWLLMLLVATALAGCQSGGNFSLFGYTTKPPFDPEICTVYVPVFKNESFQTTPNRGLEVDITRQVVHELGLRPGAPRVVSDPERADTELIGVLKKIEKRELNRNQQNHARELEVIFTCTIVWRDLRTGRILSNRRTTRVEQEAPPAFDPTLPPPPDAPLNEIPRPVTITAAGRIIHEVGETNASASKAAVDNIAKQIVNMMENPW